MNEQTAYQTPGNSHTSRQASAELQYAALTDDNYIGKNAIRQLNWATYMVDNDGKNCYPNDEVWMTDGYGDYVAIICGPWHLSLNWRLQTRIIC